MSFILVGIVSLLAVTFFVIVIALLVISLGRGAGPDGGNQPFMQTNARIVGKRTHTVRFAGYMDDPVLNGGQSVCYITFELPGGSRVEFIVSPREYRLLTEGDEGKLIFQGPRYKSFTRRWARLNRNKDNDVN